MIGIQLKFDVDHICQVRRKLQMGQTLNEEDRQLLKQIIRAGERTFYPDQMQLDQYKYNLDQICDIDPNTNPTQHDYFAEKIEEFEQKFGK